MSSIVTRTQQLLKEKGIEPGTAFGRSWLLEKMRKLSPTTKDRMEIIKDRNQQRNKTMIGRFYFFFYDAKTKETLPYWDRFPLVIPLMRYNDGFLGLNLHYIPPKDRLILLRQLSRFATGSLNDENTRLRLSYPLLKAMHTAYRATPCIKRYLAGHVRSRFIEIPTCEWDIAAALPAQIFTSRTGITKEQVWDDSKGKY